MGSGSFVSPTTGPAGTRGTSPAPTCQTGGRDCQHTDLANLEEAMYFNWASSLHLISGLAEVMWTLKRVTIRPIDLSTEKTAVTKRGNGCWCQANPLPGVVQEKGSAEGGEEIEDAQLVHLPTKLVLPALKKEHRAKMVVHNSLHLTFFFFFFF